MVHVGWLGTWSPRSLSPGRSQGRTPHARGCCLAFSSTRCVLSPGRSQGRVPHARASFRARVLPARQPRNQLGWSPGRGSRCWLGDRLVELTRGFGGEDLLGDQCHCIRTRGGGGGGSDVSQPLPDPSPGAFGGAEGRLALRLPPATPLTSACTVAYDISVPRAARRAALDVLQAKLRIVSTLDSGGPCYT